MTIYEFQERCNNCISKEQLRLLKEEALHAGPIGLSCKTPEDCFRAGEIYAMHRAKLATQIKSLTTTVDKR